MALLRCPLKNKWLIFIALLLGLFIFCPTSVACEPQILENESRLSQQENLPFIISNNRLTLTNPFQKQLLPSIRKAQVRLQELKDTFDYDFNKRLGMVYIHRAHDNWLIRFTLGGIVIEDDVNIIVSFEQVNIIRKAFEATSQITIGDSVFNTTGYMRQLGPILH